MKLYPVYLNVDKVGTTGPMRARNDDDDSLGGNVRDGAGAPPSLIRANSNSNVESNTSSSAVDLVDTSKQNRSRGSITATATTGNTCDTGFCSMSHNAPANCGLATTMTLGTYALTSLGPLPVVTATTIGVGTSAGGSMIPPAHSNSQSAGIEGSTFMAFPRSNPNSLSRPPVTRANTYTSWGTGSASEATITNTISTQQEYPFGGGTSITTTILGNGFRPSVIKSSFAGIDCAAHSHHNRDGANARYHPYLQPPPAHSMSSTSFSRTNDHVYNMYYNNVFGTGEGSGIEGRVPASRTYGNGHTSDEYDGSPTQPET